ncbi:MAG: signal peptidase I [Bryobacteraceae bacterium]|nr:signal peptidase I [Bryobacteraceae bacterium]
MVLFALTLFAGAQTGVASVPQILFLTAVVVRMWWRDPWSGYGASFVMLSTVVNAFSLWGREGQLPRPVAGLALASLFLALMYWRAGHAMGPARPWTRGIPWIAFALVLVAFPLVFQPYYTNSGGMENTVLQGDYSLALRQFGRAPKRGDVVLFHYPLERRQVFMKRVVAIGGDRVQIRDKKLILNGTPVDEPYALRNTPYTIALRDNFPETADFPLPSKEWEEVMRAQEGKDVTVPAGKLFVLGDNRDSSLDSRFWGFIEPSDVVGAPVLVYWSVEKRLRPDDVETALGKVRWDRVFRRL